MTIKVDLKAEAPNLAGQRILGYGRGRIHWVTSHGGTCRCRLFGSSIRFLQFI